jgi:hypothetical protein
MFYSLTSTWSRLSDTMQGFAHFEKTRIPEVLPQTHPQPLEIWEGEGGKAAVRRAE